MLCPSKLSKPYLTSTIYQLTNQEKYWASFTQVTVPQTMSLLLHCTFVISTLPAAHSLLVFFQHNLNSLVLVSMLAHLCPPSEKLLLSYVNNAFKFTWTSCLDSICPLSPRPVCAKRPQTPEHLISSVKPNFRHSKAEKIIKYLVTEALCLAKAASD